MKKALLLLCCYLIIGITARGQNNSIKGIVEDVAAKVKLTNATISILNAKDSTLYKFTRAAADGSFALNNLKHGNFILLLTYPEYVDYVNPFTLSNEQNHIDLKSIDMKLKSKLLNEVIIKGQATAIKIKGDTTEFNAAAYTIQPNDKVEDLLKKFPGLQVDANGKITAQGKAVEKVLVDGEEFFGDDPTLVTKNLRADMVDKVQLFEKSSDQAAFTGVDDGQKKQTLNIVLKEDKKQGYFGKAEAGYATQDFYVLQGMFNKFKNKEKVAAYVTSSNTNRTGLGWEDAGKYGSMSGNMEMTSDGGMIMYSTDDIGSQFWGEGLPKSTNGGFHYENKWNDDKQGINTNYKLGNMNVFLDKNTLNQNNLPDGIFNSNSRELTNSKSFKQKVDGTYTIKIDTTSNLKVTIDGSLSTMTKNSSYNSVTKRGDNTLVNTSGRTNDDKSKQQAFNLNALYAKKFKKPGRNYSLNLSQSYNQSNSDGYINSLNKFFNEKEVNYKTEAIDQLKDNNLSTFKISTNFTYNEPLSKFFTLVANYGLTFINGKADKRTYDASVPGVYDQLNGEYSNYFESDQLTHQVGAVFNYVKGKTVLNFGNKTNFASFNQLEHLTNQKFDRNFINWLPQASYTYKFSAQRSFSIGYNGNTTQPSVAQLQPVKTNDDPLNIPEGNPDLKPSYSSNIRLNYRTYKVISSESFYFNANYRFTNNPIVSNNTTDGKGVTIYRSANLHEKTPFSGYAYLGYNRKIPVLNGMSGGINLNFNNSKNYNYVNGEMNTSTSTSYGPSLELSSFKDKINYYFSFGPRYRAQEASLQKQMSNKGWGTSGYFDMSAKLPQKISIRTNGDYSYEPKSATYDQSIEQFIMNASLTKAFFKQENLKLVLSVNDIFNQNRGFDRFSNANSITQTTSNNINRYFMFSLVWDFNKMGGGAPQKP
ncbi:outer membrane beta-barrel family protein [Pedobacter montanisoli]|uniref:Outer membrane beta-barrel family protein n=1 Tax=Pedobacter montanisoli TaxID=2923277 RepID=A0ABS9ZUZ3_9SPHI|nr:outer membrane beta-barrel family protein [Pedobacter montanisoli]MCJ0742132.1 outer membrane beta-barrel family protein [Pedobacter montanisoli]